MLLCNNGSELLYNNDSELLYNNDSELLDNITACLFGRRYKGRSQEGVRRTASSGFTIKHYFTTNLAVTLQ